MQSIFTGIQAVGYWVAREETKLCGFSGPGKRLLFERYEFDRSSEDGCTGNSIHSCLRKRLDTRSTWMISAPNRVIMQHSGEMCLTSNSSYHCNANVRQIASCGIYYIAFCLVTKMS